MRRFFSFGRARRQREARPNLTPAERKRRQQQHLWIAVVVLALVLWAILAITSPSIPGLRAGYPSPVTVRANRSITFESKWRTELERTRAESDPSTIVYREDQGILIEQRNELNDLIQTITRVRVDPSLDLAAREARLTSLPNSTLVISSSLAARIANLDDSEWQAVSEGALNLYDRALRESNYAISEDALKTMYQQSIPYWSTLYVRSENRDLALMLAESFLKPNLVVDEEATAQRKRDARNAVTPVKVSILEGESIVREGDVITPNIQEKLEALGLLEAETNWWYIGGQGLLVAIVSVLFGIYIQQCQVPVWSSDRTLVTVLVLFSLSLLSARLLLPISSGWSYVFPLAAMVLLLAGLLNSELALVSAAIQSFLIALIADNQLSLGVTLFLGSMVGVFVFGHPERTLAFLLAGVAVALVTILTQIAVALMGTTALALENLLPILLFGAVNGALSGIISLGLYNLVGQLAGILTPFQLMELAHPTQPLLRRLMREAPGTYHHSIAVGNLAESAAEAIGADALLLRVAAYYHDIGKVLRPFFFTDNQSDRENVHNELDPQTSAAIIADHVREGLKLAQNAGIPPQLAEFIPTHHGTTVIQHFYQMALRQQDSVDIDQFRYPGPLPHTREQGILMLADAVEATVRSKAQHGQIASSREGNGDGERLPGKQTLEETVASIIDERVRSGQLDESMLTVQDLARIRRAFVSTLQGIYHPRTEYAPQLVKTP